MALLKFKELMKLVHDGKKDEIGVAFSSMTIDEVEVLCEGLKKNNVIKSIIFKDSRGKNISDVKMMLLADALEENHVIQQINWNSVVIKQLTSNKIIDCLRVNLALKDESFSISYGEFHNVGSLFAKLSNIFSDYDNIENIDFSNHDQAMDFLKIIYNNRDKFPNLKSINAINSEMSEDGFKFLLNMVSEIETLHKISFSGNEVEEYLDILEDFDFVDSNKFVELFVDEQGLGDKTKNRIKAFIDDNAFISYYNENKTENYVTAKSLVRKFVKLDGKITNEQDVEEMNLFKSPMLLLFREGELFDMLEKFNQFLENDDAKVVENNEDMKIIENCEELLDDTNQIIGQILDDQADII